METTVRMLNGSDTMATIDPASCSVNGTVFPQPLPVSPTAARSELRKRSRISLACTRCRNRKSKCDGRRPRCLSCTQLRLPCEYQRPPQQNHGDQRFRSKAQLLAKVKELEAKLMSAPADSRPRPSPGNVFASIPDSDSPPMQSPLISDLPVPDAILATRSAADDLDEETPVDILATVTFNQESESNIGHFGPSSNHEFFRSTSNAFARIVSLASSSRQALKGARPASSYRPQPARVLEKPGGQINTRDLDVIALPPGPEASALIDHFFVSIGAYFPFVSKSTLISDYGCLQGHKPRPNLGAKRALLNSVFAMASLSLGEGDSSVFHSRALACLSERHLRGTSVELVQALLLIATYQQNNQLSITSWTYHALAVKAAFQLGLHSPLGYKEFGLQEGEMRKRLWYSLINQDRVLCMCLGRPCLIPTQYIRTRRPLDARMIYRSMPVAAPFYVDSITYHNLQTSLYEIVASILHHLYNDNVEADESTKIQDVIVKRLPLQWELEGWRQHSESSCRIISGSELRESDSPSSDNFRFQILLSAHYYRALMLANAPVIIHALNERVSTPNLTQLELGFFSEHVVPVVKHDFKMAREMYQIIQTMSAYDERFLDQNNAWWLCNYTLLTVNMHFFCILLLCHLYDSLSSAAGISVIEVRHLLNQGINVMKSIQRTSLMSRKARKCLVSFLEVFDSVVCDEQDTGVNVTDPAAGEDILSLAGPMFGIDSNNFSQCVTQAANDFLWQYSQTNFLGDDLALFGGEIT